MCRYVWVATQIAMKECEISWTTDHWTGHTDETYSTVHFVCKNLDLYSCYFDLKVFKESTSGEAIHEDIDNVLIN